MTAESERRVVTVGGKGSSLSSAAVFAVANGLSLLRIDASALPISSPPLSSSDSNHQSPSSSTFPFSFPSYLTSEEQRASQLLLINKLLLSSSSAAATTAVVLASHLSDTLNISNSNNNAISPYSVTDQDLILASVSGISALLDHHSSALSIVADAVAALSCEALRADVSDAFNLMDSGDGSTSKEGVAVAADLKVFLTGSKLVGVNPIEAVFCIPQIHGNLRKASVFVHSTARVELNSGYKKGWTVDALATALLHLALDLRRLGENSWCRAELNVNSIGNEDLRSRLKEMFNRICPGPDALKHLYSSSLEAMEEDYIKFSHEVWRLSKTVRLIVSWEAITAFVSLEGIELIQKLQGNKPLGPNGTADNSKSEKKSEKKIKKKVLGKGATILMQLIKDRLTIESTEYAVLLDKWVEEFSSFLDPKDPGFDSLLKNVKEIVESNESRRLPKLPKGTRDFAKEQMAIRERAFSIISEVFKRHGAMALDTPAFELRETLMGKYGEDSKLIYDLADQGGELCSLRYDLTVPFARYVAMNGLTSFKRYQIAKVYRRDNPSKGRYREFYQCDFDIAGQYEAMGPDFEVIKILTELLNELSIGDYEVKLNHRKLLDGMLEICGVPPEKFRTICSSIDKLDKQSFDLIKKEMVEDKGLTVEVAEKIGTFVKKRGHPLELLSALKQEGSKFLDNSSSLLALNDLELVFKALEKSRCIDKIVFDLSLARGLDYYTGVIFEAVFKGATQVGSIAAGGRYDNLIGMFGTKQVPAVGASLGIERVFTIMEQLQKDQNQAVRPTETQVLVSILGDDLCLGAELVSELWDAKLKAEYMVNKRVRKHIDYAIDSRIPFIVIVGERELSEGIVKLKDVVAAEDANVPRHGLVEELQRRLNGISP